MRTLFVKGFAGVWLSWEPSIIQSSQSEKRNKWEMFPSIISKSVRNSKESYPGSLCVLFKRRLQALMAAKFKIRKGIPNGRDVVLSIEKWFWRFLNNWRWICRLLSWTLAILELKSWSWDSEVNKLSIGISHWTNLLSQELLLVTFHSKIKFYEPCDSFNQNISWLCTTNIFVVCIANKGFRKSLPILFSNSHVRHRNFIA